MAEEHKINIALAELYGWTDIQISTDYRGSYGLDEQGRLRLLPKYWEDAYTFEELWPKLTDEKKMRFTNELCSIIDREDYPTRYIGGGCSAFFATARQRAEAMLRTFDNWKEE